MPERASPRPLDPAPEGGSDLSPGNYRLRHDAPDRGSALWAQLATRGGPPRPPPEPGTPAPLPLHPLLPRPPVPWSAGSSSARNASFACAPCSVPTCSSSTAPRRTEGLAPSWPGTPAPERSCSPDKWSAMNLPPELSADRHWPPSSGRAMAPTLTDSRCTHPFANLVPRVGSWRGSRTQSAIGARGTLGQRRPRTPGSPPTHWPGGRLTAPQRLHGGSRTQEFHADTACLGEERPRRSAPACARPPPPRPPP